MSKPTIKPDWMLGVTGPQVLEPTSGKKAAGWAVDERPPREYMNWLFQNLSEWIEYIDTVSDSLDQFNQIYSAIVGTGPLATHATLNAAMADSGIPQGARILVISDLTLTSTQQITKNNCRIEFSPGVSIIRGVATTGLQISADGVKVLDGRFVNFSTAGDKAIVVDAGSDYTQIRDTRFNNCVLEIDDLANTSSILGTVTE